VIVRIFNEGQYRLADSLRDRLNELDRECQEKVEAGDADGFKTSYAQLLELIRSEGEELPNDDLSSSDVMLPPPDTTLEEAREEFSMSGLIPD
jgi:PspA-Associated protein